MIKNVILFLFLLFFKSSVFCQKMEFLGEDNNPILTESESLFLNEYMNTEQKQGVDLKGKKVIFLTGNNGRRLSSKQQYFNNIKERNNNNSKIQTFVIELNEKDKINSGGYDIIIAYWVKLFTNRSKQKIINEVKASR